MAKILARVGINALHPVVWEELPKRWKVGDTVEISVSMPRNIKLHRKAFALLNLLHKHTDYPSIDALRQAMTIGAGYVDMVVDPMTGEVCMVPKSWSFSEMDDLAFADLYKKLVLVALKLVPGSQHSDWENAEEQIALGF